MVIDDVSHSSVVEAIYCRCVSCLLQGCESNALRIIATAFDRLTRPENYFDPAALCRTLGAPSRRGVLGVLGTRSDAVDPQARSGHGNYSAGRRPPPPRVFI